MKRITVFKGYVTETAYDEATGKFIGATAEHPFAPPASAPVKQLKRKRRAKDGAGRETIEDAA